MKYGKLQRINEDFDRWMRKIQQERFDKGIDKKKMGTNILTKEMMKQQSFRSMEKELTRKDISLKGVFRNKKGYAFDLVVAGIMLLFCFIFFAVLIFVFGSVTDSIRGMGTQGNLNFTEAVDNTMGKVDNQLSSLHWIAVIIFFVMIVSFLVSSFFVKEHPLIFVPYIGIIIITIVFAAVLSNAYESILNSGVLGNMLLEMTAWTWIMLNLPIIFTVVGFIGAIFLAIGGSTGGDRGGVF